MKTINVLMTTYNGEKYLKEQIDSIFAQDCIAKGLADVRLLIRDDKSTDSTVDIINDYVRRYTDKITLIKGENIGVIKGFFTLLKECERADYYAFSDQDDYWMPNKLSVAIENIDSFSNGMPYLYSSSVTIADAQLNPIESSIDRSSIRASFENAMLENVVYGCTAVFNHNLREIVTVEYPNYTYMHDWWMYLTATAFGRHYYDEQSYMKYRQHEDNAVGNATDKLTEAKARSKNYGKSKDKLSKQLTEFVRIYEERFPANDKIEKAKYFLAAKKSFVKRIGIKKKLGLYRQRTGDDKLFAVLLLLGKY